MQYNVAAVSALFVAIFLTFTFGSREGELNDHCRLVIECRKFAYLCHANRTCQCKPYYRPNKYLDRCVGIVGQRCEYDDNCIDGAFCKEQKFCECKHDLFPNEDNTECSHSTTNIPTRYSAIPVLILVYLKLF